MTTRGPAPWPIALAAALAIACQAGSPPPAPTPAPEPVRPAPPAPAALTPAAPLPAPTATPVEAAAPLPRPAAEPARAKGEAPEPAPPGAVEKAAEEPKPPTGEELIRTFWRHVSAGRAGAAAAMLKEAPAAKALWKETLESIRSADVVGIDPFDQASWTADTEVYRVTVRIATKPDDPENPPPIPRHGWEDGVNVRWMSIKQTGADKRILGIATGP